MLQHSEKGDLNVLLLNSFYSLGLEADDFLNPALKSNYVSKFFFCGCTLGNAGNASCFIIKISSFGVFVKGLRKTLQQKNQTKIDKKSLKQMAINILEELIGGLKNENGGRSEQINFCDESGQIIMTLDRSSKKEEISKVADSFFGLRLWVHEILRKNDDIFKLYKGIKGSVRNKNENIILYYTIHGDDAFSIRNNSKGNFNFCILSKRRERGCRRRECINEIASRAIVLKELFDFVGLQ